MPELTAPFVMKDDDKRIVYGPVLVPDEADSDDDTVSAEKIEEVAHQFVEDYGNIDLMHSLNNVGKMIESYILPMDLAVDENLTVPKGSWMLGVRVTNDDAWEATKNNQLGGFSIMAIEKTAVKSTKAEKDAAQKRTTLNDLEDGWIVNAVSLVDEPAVPKAKWIAVKSKGKGQSKKEGKNVEITKETVQKAISGSLEHRKQLIRRKVYETFDSESTDSYVHSTLDDSVIIRVMDFFTNSERMLQLGYAIDEQGEVTFTTNPQEVRIEESVVPVESNGSFATLGTGENQATQSSKSDDGFMAKIMKKLGFNQSEKAGRSISDSNFTKLQTAKEVIDELVDTGTKERANKSTEVGDNMNQEEVEKLIGKSVEPVNEKLDELINTLKAEAKGEEGENQGESSSKSKEEQGDNQEDNNTEENASTKSKEKDEGVSKSDYDKVVEELEYAKKNRPFSKRITGQDNMVEKEKEDKPDRNAFGYKVK